MAVEPLTYLFADDGETPNNPRLPLVLYRGAVALEGSDPAAAFERCFARHGWPDGWRNGIFAFHHFHSHTHETLGIARGRARVEFGGARGREVDLEAGDVAILPAGCGHRRVSSSADLLVVGNNSNQAGTGISISQGSIANNAVGGSITFRSNNNISQNGAITMVSNPGTTAAVLTYDVSTGNSTSSIVAGSLTITGTNTGPIDYNLFAAGAQLIPGAISVPGTITLDNTYGGTSGVGGAPTSGYITASNLSLATTNIGIVVNSALSANRGVVIRGASYGGTNTMGIRIWSNITSSQGNIDLTGFTQSGRAISNINPGIAWQVAFLEPLVAGLRAGGDYYDVAARALRTDGYPLKPFVTFRLPTLARVQAAIPDLISSLLLFAVAGLTIAAWYRRLGPHLTHPAPRLVVAANPRLFTRWGYLRVNV